MFDRLIDFALDLIDDLLPVTVIEHFNKGVRLRFGKYNKTLEPGLHFKIPFIDQILTMMVKTKTLNLLEQSLTTKDDIQIVVKAAIKYEISNIEKALLEVNEPVDAIGDMTQGIIRDLVISKEYNALNLKAEELESEILKLCRSEARRWGIEIKNITITDLAKIRTIRLMQK